MFPVAKASVSNILGNITEIVFNIKFPHIPNPIDVKNIESKMKTVIASSDASIKFKGNEKTITIESPKIQAVLILNFFKIFGAKRFARM